MSARARQSRWLAKHRGWHTARLPRCTGGLQAGYQLDLHCRYAAGLQLPLAAKLLACPLAPAGPFLILLGLLLAGIATVMSYQTVLVKDDGGKKKKASRTKASRIWRSLSRPDQEAAASTTPPFHNGATTTRKHACASRNAASASAGVGARANIKPR